MSHDFLLRIRHDAKVRGGGRPNGDEDDFRKAILHYQNRMAIHDREPETRRIAPPQSMITQAELDHEEREAIRVHLGWAALGLMTYGHAIAIVEVVRNMYFAVWQMGYAHKMLPGYVAMMVPALHGMHFGREDIDEVVVWLERNERYLLWDAEAARFELSDDSPDGYFRRWRKRTPERDINIWRDMATVFTRTSYEINDTLPDRLETQYRFWFEQLSLEDDAKKRDDHAFRLAWAALGLMTYGRKEYIEAAIAYLPVSDIGNQRDMPEAIAQMVPAFDTKAGWNMRACKPEALTWAQRNTPYLHWDASQWQFILSNASPDGPFHLKQGQDDR